MCGFVGVFNLNSNTVSKVSLKKMASTIRHGDLTEKDIA